MRTLNLRICFPVFIALLLGVVLLLWSSLQYQHLVERTQDQKLGQWRDTLSSLQINLGHELLSGDTAEAQFMVSQYAIDPDLQVLAVIDQQGRVLLANRYEWRGKPVSLLPGYKRFVHRQENSDAKLLLDIHLDNHGDSIHATLPVALPGQADSLGNLRTGKIYFLYDLTRARQEVRDLLIADMSIMSPLLLVAALLVWIMFRYFVSRPLEVLRNASKKMSAGEFEPVELEGKSELARLAQSFNEMARRISTEQRRLYDSEQRFRQLADNINEVFWLGSPDWREVFYVSPAFEKLWGKPVEAIYRDPLSWLETVHPEDREQVMADIPADLDAIGDCVDFREYRIQKPDGEVRWIKARAYPVRDADGKIVRVAGIAEDITDRVSMEEALRRSQKMEAIGQLSGGIAHDFNNQLGIVIGYLDFLKSEAATDDRVAKWIDTASRATLRCMDLTRQLLAFSRKKGQEKSVVDVNAVLSDLETMVTRLLTPEIEVQYFLSDALWKTEINAGEFEDAILNLVINARDAMPGGGKILIETTNHNLGADYAIRNPDVTPGEYVQIMISDTGTGMDERTLERVFEPFFTTKPETRGTGLGMAMVYGFARRYGGSVKVYSEVGAGTTVRLYLPRATGKEQQVSHDKDDMADLPGGRESVLIVDDEPDLLQLAAQYLGRLGYRTLTAENACGALQILDNDEQVDLLFSDVVMPGGMNGYELAQQATDRRPGIKVLLTSGYTSKTIAHNGLARFSAQLLTKPYREADLARRIRSVLDENMTE